MIVAGGRGRLAGFEINSRRPRQDADNGFEQRRLDALAAAVAMARLEREQDALRRENSAQLAARIFDWFDLENLRAIVAQDLRAERPGKIAREIDNFDSRQRRLLRFRHDRQLTRVV